MQLGRGAHYVRCPYRQSQPEREKEVVIMVDWNLEVESLSAGDFDAAYDIANLLRSKSKSGLIAALYELSFAQGVIEAALNYGVHLESEGDLKSALEWYAKAFESGDKRAAVKIAQIHNDLDNPVLALDWYRKSEGAPQGLVGHSRTARALFQPDEAIAVLSEHSRDNSQVAAELVVEYDVLTQDEGRELLESHWNRRVLDPSAYLVGVPLGNLYSRSGEFSSAVSVYRETAKQGDAHAAFNLGIQLLSVNRDKAIRWIRKAKKMGDKRAKWWLKEYE